MKWFARWRVKVWDRRVELYRNLMNHADECPVCHMPGEQERTERQLTRALVKRTAWRKRAGIRKGARKTKDCCDRVGGGPDSNLHRSSCVNFKPGNHSW